MVGSGGKENGEQNGEQKLAGSKHDRGQPPEQTLRGALPGSPQRQAGDGPFDSQVLISPLRQRFEGGLRLPIDDSAIPAKRDPRYGKGESPGKKLRADVQELAGSLTATGPPTGLGYGSDTSAIRKMFETSGDKSPLSIPLRSLRQAGGEGAVSRTPWSGDYGYAQDDRGGLTRGGEVRQPRLVLGYGGEGAATVSGLETTPRPLGSPPWSKYSPPGQEPPKRKDGGLLVPRRLKNRLEEARRGVSGQRSPTKFSKKMSGSTVVEKIFGPCGAVGALYQMQQHEERAVRIAAEQKKTTERKFKGKLEDILRDRFTLTREDTNTIKGYTPRGKDKKFVEGLISIRKTDLERFKRGISDIAKRRIRDPRQILALADALSAPNARSDRILPDFNTGFTPEHILGTAREEDLLRGDLRGIQHDFREHPVVFGAIKAAQTFAVGENHVDKARTEGEILESLLSSLRATTMLQEHFSTKGTGLRQSFDFTRSAEGGIRDEMSEGVECVQHPEEVVRKKKGEIDRHLADLYNLRSQTKSVVPGEESFEFFPGGKPHGIDEGTRVVPKLDHVCCDPHEGKVLEGYKKASAAVAKMTPSEIERYQEMFTEAVHKCTDHMRKTDIERKVDNSPFRSACALRSMIDYAEARYGPHLENTLEESRKFMETITPKSPLVEKHAFATSPPEFFASYLCDMERIAERLGINPTQLRAMREAVLDRGGIDTPAVIIKLYAKGHPKDERSLQDHLTHIQGLPRESLEHFIGACDAANHMRTHVRRNAGTLHEGLDSDQYTPCMGVGIDCTESGKDLFTPCTPTEERNIRSLHILERKIQELELEAQKERLNPGQRKKIKDGLEKLMSQHRQELFEMKQRQDLEPEIQRKARSKDPRERVSAHVLRHTRKPGPYSISFADEAGAEIMQHRILTEQKRPPTPHSLEI